MITSFGQIPAAVPTILHVVIGGKRRVGWGQGMGVRKQIEMIFLERQLFTVVWVLQQTQNIDKKIDMKEEKSVLLKVVILKGPMGLTFVKR